MPALGAVDKGNETLPMRGVSSQPHRLRPLNPNKAFGVFVAEVEGPSLSPPAAQRVEEASSNESYARADITVGGRLALCLPLWEGITRDDYVLSIIRNGRRIILSEPVPEGVRRRWSPALSPLFQRVISDEVNTLLKKGAIERVTDSPRLCLSPIFVVPKPSGKYRVILNLKRINRYIPDERFRMETLTSIPVPHPVRLGSYNRPFGRILSYTDPLWLQIPVGFCVPETMLPIQGTPVRPEVGAAGFYPSSLNPRRAPQVPRPSPLHIPRQLVCWRTARVFSSPPSSVFSCKARSSVDF